MGKEFGLYGPWVRHDWCPRCVRSTEQSRWHRRRLGEPPERGELRVRCHECATDVVRPSGRDAQPGLQAVVPTVP